MTTALPRRASTWSLARLQAPGSKEGGAPRRGSAAQPGPSTPADSDADTDADTAEAETPASASVATIADTQAVYEALHDMLLVRARAPWGIDTAMLRRLAVIAARYNISDALLHATLADADTKRRFAGSHDFEWRHFEYFLGAPPDVQRAASVRYAA